MRRTPRATTAKVHATGARPRGFVLLEVLVSLAIMGVTFAMVLSSFTTSMKVASISDHLTEASVLARDLLEEWEVTPPQAGLIEGQFDGHPEYSYQANYHPEKIDYEDFPDLTEGRLALYRAVSLDILYHSPRAGVPPKRILHLESALSSSERFGAQARQSNNIPLGE